MRFLALITLLTAGCARPMLGNAGVACASDPDCGDGERCDSTHHRCVPTTDAPDLGGAPDDLSTPDDLSGAPTDLAHAPHDLAHAAANPDLAVVNTSIKGCHGYAACMSACTTQTCLDNCGTKVTTQGQNLYNTSLGCGQEWCLGKNDPADPTHAGPGDCTVDSTGTQLTDPKSKPAGTCDSCLQNALAGLFGDSCSPPSSSNCNPSSCASTYSSCQADGP